LLRVSRGLRPAMPGLGMTTLTADKRLASRGW
jgi:hypothetical protein